MKLQVRGGLAVLAIVGSALVATGCGSGSGATSAAKSSAALDFVPKSAIGYVTVDTDFGGDNWDQFSSLATALDPDFKSVEDQVAKSTSNDEDDVDYAKDIDPWLGKNAGAALLDVKSDEAADFFVWAEVSDKAAFEKFAKKRDFEKGAKVGDFQSWKNADDEDMVIGVSDDLAILTTDSAMLKTIVNYDGDSITDADGVEDAIDEVDGDALGTLVINGAGLRAAAKNDDDLKQIADLDQLKDFKSFAMSMGVQDDGFRVDGHAISDGDDKLKNTEHPVFEDMPANTLLAISGNDLGGQLSAAADAAGKDSADTQQMLGQATALLGVTMDELADTLDGEFVLGVSADDAGLGSLATGVAGAAGGGGLSSVDPTSLLSAGTIMLAFEETGDTSKTLGKIVTSVGGLLGGSTTAAAAGKTSTVGKFTLRQLSLGGIPLTEASTKDLAAVSIGVSPFASWGKDTLGDSDAFQDAWKAADAPDETWGTMWLDAARVAKLAGAEGSDDAKLGGMVGWIEGDDSDAHLGAFLHVTKD